MSQILTRIVQTSLIVGFLLLTKLAFGQVLLDGSTTGSTITTCDTLFYDIGGLGGNLDGGTYDITFCPTDAADFANIRFDLDNTNNNVSGATFTIYDGNSTSASQIFTRSGGTLPNLFKNTHWYAGMSGSGDGSNCLTFEVSGGTSAGWNAHIFCSDTNVAPNDEICDAIPLSLGVATPGANTHSTRSCFGTSHVGSGTSYNYGYYATNTSAKEIIGDVFYSFIAPTSGAVSFEFVHTPLFADDDLNLRVQVLKSNSCATDCASADYTTLNTSDYNTPASCAAGATSCSRTNVYYQRSEYNTTLRFERTGLAAGEEYIIQVKSGFTIYNENGFILNGNVCGGPGVFSGDYEITLSDAEPIVDNTANCNVLLAPSNDSPCSAIELGIECNKTNGSNIGGSSDPCSDITDTDLNAGTGIQATVWFKYVAQTEEIGQLHNVIIKPSDCYTTSTVANGCDANNNGANDDVNVLTSSGNPVTSPKLFYAILEIDENPLCTNDDIVNNSTNLVQTPSAGVASDGTGSLSFTPQANKEYYVVVATTGMGAYAGYCDFEIDVDVYENLAVNGGLPAGYFCDFPDASTAAVQFEPLGGRGTYTAYLETDGTAIASWTAGAAETSSMAIDTIDGEGFLDITNISDGETWKVTFDDGTGCTYQEGATYDYDLWCNLCDGYTQLNIVQQDSSVCPDEQVFLAPKVDASVPAPFYAGLNADRADSYAYPSGKKESFYNNNGQMAVNLTSIDGVTNSVDEICFKARGYWWDRITLTLELDGCGSPYTIWQGNKVGGSDNAPFGSVMNFCLTTGWENGAGTITTSSAALNAAWNGCDAETPIKVVSSGGVYSRYFWPYGLTAKVLDEIDKPVGSFKSGHALQWIPDASAFTPSIADGSELAYTPFTDPDSLTATFASSSPGAYIYNLVGTDANGCEVGQDVNHGGPTGAGQFRVDVYDAPVIDNVVYENVLCFGGSTDITATVTSGTNALDPSLGYKWSITGATGTAAGFLLKDNTNSTTILTSGDGSVSFNLTVTDARGCSDSYDSTITINAVCPADAGKY